jgi:hypothetical protein
MTTRLTTRGTTRSTTRGTSPALAFTPFDLEPLTLWWSFRDAATTLKTGDVPAGDGDAIAKQLDLVAGTQIANASGPTLDSDAGPGGVRAAFWDGVNDVLNNTADIIPNVSTCILMFQPISFTANDRIWDTNSAGARAAFFQRTGGDYRVGSDIPNPGAIIPNGKWTCAAMVHNGTAVMLQIDGKTPLTGTAAAENNTMRFNLGANGNTVPASGFAHMRMTDILFFNSVLTSAEIRSVREYLYKQTARTYGPGIVCDGNSITRGVTLPVGDDYPAVLGDLLAAESVFVDITNKGVSGQRTIAMLADFDSDIQPLFDPDRTDNFLIGWEILNDWNWRRGEGDEGQREASDNSVNAFWEYCDYAKAKGWKVVAIDVLPTVDYSVGQFPDELAYINGRLNDEWEDHVDALVRISQDSSINDPSDTDNYYDGTHQTSAGAAITAGIVKTTIDTII